MSYDYYEQQRRDDNRRQDEEDRRRRDDYNRQQDKDDEQRRKKRNDDQHKKGQEMLKKGDVLGYAALNGLPLEPFANKEVKTYQQPSTDDYNSYEQKRKRFQQALEDFNKCKDEVLTEITYQESPLALINTQWNREYRLDQLKQYIKYIISRMELISEYDGAHFDHFIESYRDFITLHVNLSFFGIYCRILQNCDRT